MNRMQWIQRRFTFDFPAEHAPEILERLRGTPARLEERVAALDEARLTRRPADGKWSIQEHAGHLIEVEALFTGRLDDYVAGLAELRPAEMSGRSTFGADFNARPVDEILASFRQVRADLLARVAGMGPDAPALSAHHPRLNRPMRLVDMFYFLAEHDDYHLARIGELLA